MSVTLKLVRTFGSEYEALMLYEQPAGSVLLYKVGPRPLQQILQKEVESGTGRFLVMPYEEREIRLIANVLGKVGVNVNTIINLLDKRSCRVGGNHIVITNPQPETEVDKMIRKISSIIREGVQNV